MRSSALLTNTPAQLGMNEKFLPSGFYQRRLPTSYNIKNYLTKPSINNNSTTDLWYLGVARYVWTSISDFCSNGLGFDLKHGINIVNEYLQEAPILADNEMMIYNGRSTVAVG